MKDIYRHKISGDIFGIQTDDDGRIIATCGPLFSDGFDPDCLDFDSYWNSEIQAKLDDFQKITPADCLELLRQNGFVIQHNQPYLF